MTECSGYRDWMATRRSVLKAAALGVVGWLAPSAISQIAARKRPEGRDILVVVFLRGGADGLNLVAPYADDDYHRLRPTLALQSPKAGPRADRALDLDGFFGLHPSLAPILPLYHEGKMAVLHAVGSDDRTRSHFEAMAAMEQGRERSGTGVASGWLGRYLNESESPSPLRAVSFSANLPTSLRGAGSVMNLTSISDYRLEGGETFAETLHEMYADGGDEMAQAGRDSLELLQSLAKLDYQSYRPEGAATYPDTDLGNGLRQAAFLAKAELGVEVVCLDMYGWDTHVLQGAGVGNHANLVDHLGKCLAAFAADMGKAMDHTSTIVMTEFGRRAYENGGLGTDHGRAGCLFAIGGHVNGGKVHGRWPGLREDALDGGDLRVTTDYRNVLAEVLKTRMGFDKTDRVFPGLAPRPVGLFSQVG